MAMEVVDIKSENRDLKWLLQSRQPGEGFNNNVGESRHSVFEKNVSRPLKSKDYFKHFEEDLKVEVRSNLVKFYMNKDFPKLVDVTFPFSGRDASQFFGRNVEETIKRMWKEVMSKELIRLYTWSGTPIPNSGKHKGMALKGFRLMSAVIETVKYG